MPVGDVYTMKRILDFIILFLSVGIVNSAFASNIYEPYEPALNEIVFSETTYPIDAIDPISSTNAKGANYPGLRGANQFVIYSPSFGYRTNTNEFGTEAIIEGNTVTSLSGADSLIPADGIVISGHGKAKTWINEHIMVGSKIYVDIENKTITSYITSDTFLYAAQERIKEVQDMLAYYCIITAIKFNILNSQKDKIKNLEENDKSLYPATWEKYHCFILKDEIHNYCFTYFITNCFF